MSEALLPCPFCGGKAERFTNAVTNRMVNCRSCGAAAFDTKWQARHRPAGQAELTSEVVRLRQALEDVANPLGKLQRDAEAQGCHLSGMAYTIARDIGFIQQIAHEALAPLSQSKGEG